MRRERDSVQGGQETDWEHSENHVELLSQFLLGQNVEGVLMHREYWEKRTGQELERTLQRFRELAWITETTLSTKLGHFSKNKLAALLKERGLKSSGNKPQLIERLAHGDPAGAAKLVQHVESYECTGKGRAIAEPYVARREQERLERERKVVNALRNGDLHEASHLCGTDCLELLSGVFVARPATLPRVTDEELHVLRMIAGAYRVLGRIDAHQWFPELTEIESVPDMGTPNAAAQVLSRADFVLDVQRFKEAGIEQVRISRAQDACTYCRGVAHRIYEVDAVPQLPLSTCASVEGCRCLVLPHLGDPEE
jgi:hypothetical protein